MAMYGLIPVIHVQNNGDLGALLHRRNQFHRVHLVISIAHENKDFIIRAG